MNLLETCLVRACGIDASSVCDGKQAMTAEHGRAVEAAPGWRLSKSINLDAALSKRFPNDSRWDYGVELEVQNRRTQVDWIEVHPASSGEVETMIKKKEWLIALLSRTSSCPPLGSRNLHWLATGGVHIDAQRRRKLAAAGLRMPQKKLRLPIQCDRG